MISGELILGNMETLNCEKVKAKTIERTVETQIIRKAKHNAGLKRKMLGGRKRRLLA